MKGVPDPGSLLADSAWVRSLARHLVRDEHTADDIAQDALLSAVRQRPGRMRAWLRTTVRNLAVTAHRRQKRRRQREQVAARPESTEAAADLVARAEAQRRVVAAVLALDDPYRTVVLLRYFDDLSPGEMAQRTGEPAATVRSRLKRALDMLRARLDAEYGGRRGAWCAALLSLALAPRRALATGGIIVGAKSKAALLAALLVLLLATGWIALALREARVAPRSNPVSRAVADAPTGSGATREAAPEREAQRRVSIDGIVIDRNGTPVGGAWVAIVRASATRHGLHDWLEALELAMDPPAPVAETRAGANGRFRLWVAAGSPSVIAATAPGYGVAQLDGLDLEQGASNAVLRLAPDALLRGRVEGPAGEPIEGARVGLWKDVVPLARLAATTDASGGFEIAASAGTHVAVVDHPDYAGMVFHRVELPADRTVFRLERGTPLEGVVRHIDTREPLAGVQVAVYLYGGKVEGPLPQRVRTGADGRFRFARLPARGHLSVFVDGGRRGRLAATTIACSESWKLQEILLGAGETVSGRVVRRNGDAMEGVAGVRVLVLDYTTGFGHRGTAVTSGPDGRFSAEGIGPRARAVLDPRERRLAQLRTTEPMQVEVVDSVTVRGRVLDDEGEPVFGALVGVEGWSLGGYGLSGDGGVFVLRGVAPGAELSAGKDGYDEARGTASVGVELVLRRQRPEEALGANSLWGTVVDRRGEPMLGVWVSVSGKSVIARRGRYEFTGLGDDELKIVASRSGFRIARLRGVRARPGGVEMPPLVLEEAPPQGPAREQAAPPSGSLSIEGVVLDERGRPKPLAAVGHVGPAGDTVWTRAGLNGRFRISALAPGSYRVRAGACSPHVYDSIVVDAGESNLVLRPRLGATIEGCVVGVRCEELPFMVVAIGRRTHRVMTDDEGHFVIEGLPDGRYTVRTDRYGWFPEPVLEGIVAGTKGLELGAIRAVRIRGKVRTSDGSPVAKPDIYAAGGSTHQDRGGEFEIRGLRPGREYTIRVRAEGKTVLRKVRAPAADVVIVID